MWLACLDRKRDVKDGKLEDTSRQPEQIRAFRDTWKIGIHSYLAYLRDRLVIARELLTETGSIFVQIGDENVHLVRCLMDEVFGSENFCVAIVVTKTYGLSSPTARVNVLSTICDYVLWYAKSIQEVKYRQIYIPKRIDDDSAQLLWIEDANGIRRRLTTEEKKNPEAIPTGSRAFRSDHIISAGWSESLSKPFVWNNKTYSVSANHHWKTTQNGLLNLTRAGRLQDSAGSLRYLRFIDDFPVTPLQNVWDDVGTGQFTEERLYVVQTSHKVVQRCLLMTTDPGDLVLDPTCGSGTTAYVAEQWGRRWITIDTSRVALALARTRLMSAKFPYYLLADSPEGLKKEAELTGQEPPSYPTARDIRKGFVYKRVPHVTLKSIANNPDIREGMTRAEIDAAIAPPCRDRDPLRPALRRQEPHPGERAVHGREPLARPDRLDRRGTAGIRADRPEATRPGRLRDDDPRQPPESRGSEHVQERAAHVRPPGAARRGLDSRHGRVHQRRRQDPARRRDDRAGVWHRHPPAGQGSRQGSRLRHRLRHPDRLRLRLRPARLRGSQALRQAHGPPGADEPRPPDRRHAQEHRGRQPVHGLRRARHRHHPRRRTARSSSK